MLHGKKVRLPLLHTCTASGISILSPGDTLPPGSLPILETTFAHAALVPRGHGRVIFSSMPEDLDADFVNALVRSLAELATFSRMFHVCKFLVGSLEV